MLKVYNRLLGLETIIIMEKALIEVKGFKHHSVLSRIEAIIRVSSYQVALEPCTASVHHEGLLSIQVRATSCIIYYTIT